MKEFTQNEDILGNMRICLMFFAKLTHTRIKKKPEDYTMEEMMDAMDKMKNRLASRPWRAWFAFLDIVKDPRGLIAVTVILILVIKMIM